FIFLTNIAAKSVEELIDLDAKSFELGSKTARIAQVNVVDVPEALERKDAFLAAMEKDAKANGYDLFMLVITNVLDSDSEVLFIGDDESKSAFAKAFGKELVDSEAHLPGVVSRKKQIVPPLTRAFEA
ncbi:manganese-dependent inorganic pyrophosphatase, partial [Lactobacillus delbrueckii subsp. lactis]|nr:manganese-dependent inorganic pyrophosphatase [Lactobacillus delbrueckii subsp. lactis]